MTLDVSAHGTLLPGVPRQGGPDKEPGGQGPRRRGRWVLAGALAVVVAGLAAAGYLLLGGGGGGDTGVVAAATHRAGGQSAPASATTSPVPSATSASAARNPFAVSVATGAAASATGAPAPTVTVTTTVTSTASAAATTYLGLYGYTAAGKADFWVNAREYVVERGGRLRLVVHLRIADIGELRPGAARGADPHDLPR